MKKQGGGVQENVLYVIRLEAQVVAKKAISLLLGVRIGGGAKVDEDGVLLKGGTLCRGIPCKGGRWEPLSRPAGPRRALAYEGEDVAIFAKINDNYESRR